MDDKQMREAFSRIITNNPMVPSKADPEYDEWLFRQVWQAAVAYGMERAKALCRRVSRA